MTRTRVLVIDDSATIRRLLVDLLGSEPGFEVVAVANGPLGLARIERDPPDLVVLDVEMPEMHGLECLRRIRERQRRLPVIMFSNYTERGAQATIDALFAGATDYVTKPWNAPTREAARERVRAELLPKIDALRPAASPVAPVRPATDAGASSAPVRVVAIGASTGGPNALAALLGALPATFPVPIVIVQHMPPTFTRLLAESLTAKGRLVVVEAGGGERLEPGRVLVAPGGRHLVVEELDGIARARLDDGPPENSSIPSVDVLFRSAAAVFGAATLGVILTGMGQDGLRGARAIHDAGGRIVVQDEATSIVWGMPGFVAREGLAETVMPLDGIAGELRRRTGAASAAAVEAG